MTNYPYHKYKYKNRCMFSFPDNLYNPAIERMRQMDVSFQELIRIALAFYLDNTDNNGNPTQETKPTRKDAAKNH
jgi:hypothetical protein